MHEGCVSLHSSAAPEQLMGMRCTLAADVYSFGLVLVELTTQRNLYRRGEWQLPRAPEDCPQVPAASRNCFCALQLSYKLC